MISGPARSLFTIPRSVCYLNAATMTPQPKSVVAAGLEATRQRAHAWRISPPDFFADVELLRTLFAELLGCNSDNIALVPAASYGIACAAKNISVRRGQKILLLAGQFPSHYYSWVRLAEESGAEVCIVDTPSDLDWTSAVLSAIEAHKDRIAMAALPNHHWSNGAPLDLGHICKQLRKLGATTVLDITQTLGACPFDLAAIAPDYLVAAGYKWLFCPYSISFLYVADAHFGGVPLEENWANRKGSEEFSLLVNYADEYQGGARRFDVGERANFSAVPGAIAAIRQLLDWQVGNLSNQLDQKSSAIANIFEEFGFSVPERSRRAPHFQGIDIPDTFEGSLVAALAEQNVFTSQRGNSLRIAPHLYNDEKDLRKLRKVLARTIMGK